MGCGGSKPQPTAAIGGEKRLATRAFLAVRPPLQLATAQWSYEVLTGGFMNGKWPNGRVKIEPEGSFDRRMTDLPACVCNSSSVDLVFEVGACACLASHYTS
jgi:hypothetical protein